MDLHDFGYLRPGQGPLGTLCLGGVGDCCGHEKRCHSEHRRVRKADHSHRSDHDWFTVSGKHGSTVSTGGRTPKTDALRGPHSLLSLTPAVLQPFGTQRVWMPVARSPAGDRGPVRACPASPVPLSTPRESQPHPGQLAAAGAWVWASLPRSAAGGCMGLCCCLVIRVSHILHGWRWARSSRRFAGLVLDKLCKLEEARKPSVC